MCLLITILGARAVIELFVNTTKQSAVFHLTKCRDSTLYSTLLFLLLLIVFKEFSNNRDLTLGAFFSLCSKGFFLETKLAIKSGHDFCVSLYMFSFISLEYLLHLNSYSYFVEILK